MANLEHGQVELINESHVEGLSVCIYAGEEKMATPKSITPNIRKHAHHLAVLARGSPAERKRVLRDAPDTLHNALADVSRVVLAGKLKMSPTQLARAQRHVVALQKLAHAKTTKKERADMLRPQRGGFLGRLADILGQVIGPVLGTLFK